MIKDVSEVQECPDCASANIVKQPALDQLVCKDCGLLFEPLDPVTEAAYEKAHDLTMGGRKTAKAKPAAKGKKKK
ncbi:MAG: hypothetical protein AABY01_02610 [Nanoarchaeota archaeon]